MNKYRIILFDLYNTLIYDDELIPGAKEAIEYLYNLGLNLYIASNGIEYIAKERLKTLKINHYIKDIYGYEKTGSAKPHKEFFNFIYEDLGKPPKNTFLIVGGTQLLMI